MSVGARAVEEGLGGPLWSPASCSPLGGTRSHPHQRATIKALPASTQPPSPLRMPGFVSSVDAYWAPLAGALVGRLQFAPMAPTIHGRGGPIRGMVGARVVEWGGVGPCGCPGPSVRASKVYPSLSR